MNTRREPARFVAFTSRDRGEWITPPGAMLCLAAAVSLAPIAGMLTSEMSRAFDPSLTTAIRDSRAFLPYVGILALALSGVRRTAAILAIFTGIPGAIFGIVMAMLTGLAADYTLFAVLQLVLTVAAFAELRLWDERAARVGKARTLISIAFSLLMFGAATSNLISRNVQEQNRRGSAQPGHDSAPAVTR